MPSQATAKKADTRLIVDNSLDNKSLPSSDQVDMYSERGFQYLAFSPDWNVRKCFYGAYNRYDNKHLQVRKRCESEICSANYD